MSQWKQWPRHLPGATLTLRARVVVLSLVSLAACVGTMEDAKSDFKQGRYAEAREGFAREEAQSRTWSDRRRAEYALYRGLTHGALGDRQAAATWLREARTIDDAHPGSLSEDDRARLRLGLESIAPDVAAPSP